MQDFELSADEVADLQMLADPAAWERVRYVAGKLVVPDDLVETLGLDMLSETMLAARKAGLLAAVANKRWQVETSGIVVNGASIRTDAKSQARVSGAALLALSDPDLTTIDWEAQPGEWVTVAADTMTAIGIAVGRHVQACFSHARVLGAAITTAADDAALDAIDIEAGWPA